MTSTLSVAAVKRDRDDRMDSWWHRFRTSHLHGHPSNERTPYEALCQHFDQRRSELRAEWDRLSADRDSGVLASR